MSTDSSPDVWMPLHIDRYLGDTTMLSTEQHGAYVLLLMAMWKGRGVLPDDDAKLAQAARLTPARWRAMRETIRPFFRSDGGGGLVQKRLLLELKRAQQRAMAGQKGGLARARNRSETASESASETRSETHSEHGSEPASETCSDNGSEPRSESLSEKLPPTPVLTPTNTKIQGLRSAVSEPPARGMRAREAGPEDLTIPQAAAILAQAGLTLQPHDQRIAEMVRRGFTGYELEQAGAKAARHVTRGRNWMPYVVEAVAGMRADAAAASELPAVTAAPARPGSMAEFQRQMHELKQGSGGLL